MSLSIKLIKNQFLIFLLVYSTSVLEGKTRSCVNYLKDANTIFSLRVPSDAQDPMRVEATFAHDGIQRNVFCLLPLVCQSSIFPLLNLTPMDNYNNGVQTGKKIQYWISSAQNSEVFDLIRVRINGKTLCRSKTARTNTEVYHLEIPILHSYTNQQLQHKRLPAMEAKPILSSISMAEGSCGVVKQVRGFVLGGKQKGPEKWPWVAAVYVGDDYTCSATFITRSRALTAAHCFKRKTRASEVQLYGYNDKYLPVRQIQRHHRFNKIPKNDIAYVDLQTPIIERDFVPVCLTPQTSRHFIGETGTVVTYAPVTKVEIQTGEMGELRGGTIKVVPKEKCVDESGTTAVPKDGFCAGNGKNAYLCHGDSGGGIYALLDGKWFLRGVLSTGLVDSKKKKCAPDDYVIFMDVMRYESFINPQNPAQQTIGFDFET